MNQQKQMTELIALWRASGLTKASFCRKQQISVHQFNYWLKKNSQVLISDSKESELSFFSIENPTLKKSAAVKTKSTPALSVELPNGIKINFFSC
jgi:hypothetical protein